MARLLRTTRKIYLDKGIVSIVAPSVTTNVSTSVATTTATGNGSLDSMGGVTVTEMGFVWSTLINPTTSDSKVTVAVAQGAYSGSITGLSSSTFYYVRAYAINAIGTSYGANDTFTTSSGAATSAYIRRMIMGMGS